MTDHAFPEAWRRGLYETIMRRRDMRSFLPIPSRTRPWLVSSWRRIRQDQSGSRNPGTFS